VKSEMTWSIQAEVLSEEHVAPNLLHY
jgi:hypothetical protein